MVSRHGLLPHAHIEQQSTAWVSPLPRRATLDRRRAGRVRPRPGRGGPPLTASTGATCSTACARTPSLWWQRLAIEERRRFLSTYARQWEVRRHRMAPAVYDRINDYRKFGRLKVLAGGIEGADSQDGRALVRVGADDVVADAVINCTGPLTDLDPHHRPAAAVAPAPAGWSHRTRCASASHSTPDGQVKGADGAVVPGLYAVGPPRKGILWESTAIPEIRTQAAQVGRAVLTRTGPSPSAVRPRAAPRARTGAGAEPRR